MAVATTFDLYQGNREVLRESFEPIPGQNIIQGMMVTLELNPLDANYGKLKKASGDPNEVAYVAENDQSTGFCDNGNKISCLVGECEFCTSYFVADTYAIGDRLEVSPDAGPPSQAGYLRKYSAGVSPVVGRYMGTVTRDSNNVALGSSSATLMKVHFLRQ